MTFTYATRREGRLGRGGVRPAGRPVTDRTIPAAFPPQGRSRVMRTAFYRVILTANISFQVAAHGGAPGVGTFLSLSEQSNNGNMFMRREQRYSLDKCLSTSVASMYFMSISTGVGGCKVAAGQACVWRAGCRPCVSRSSSPMGRREGIFFFSAITGEFPLHSCPSCEGGARGYRVLKKHEVVSRSDGCTVAPI